MATSSPDKIRKRLEELWINLGQQSEETEGVLRACSLSLIVVTPSDGELAPLLGELMHAHPARAIVVSLAPNAAQEMDAQVQADCWLPFGGKQQICCERIEVTSGADAASHIPSLVRALTAPDLPVVVYHRGAHCFAQQVLADITAVADKVIIDSATIDDLEVNVRLIRHLKGAGRHVGDLAWTRLTRWRAALAQFFDDPAQLARLPLIRSIAIEWEGNGEPVSAYYLAAWLDDALGRRLNRTFTRSGESTRSRVKSVRLSGEGVDISVTVGQDRSAVFESDHQRRTSFLPLPTECELLSEELSILGPDPIYDAVLDHLPQLLKPAA